MTVETRMSSAAGETLQ